MTTTTTTSTATPTPTSKATPSNRPAPPSGPVTAELVFFSAPSDGSIPFNNVDYQLTGLPEHNYNLSTHSVPISDIRDSPAGTFTLDHDAFTVLSSQPPSSPAIDWDNDASVKDQYYPEVERLLLEHVPGANRIYIFDHTVRRADPAAAREPVLRVHIDQTAKSAAQRVHRHLGADAETLLKGRWRLINVWRPLTANPVESYPLAFASSASVKDEEVTPVEHRYPDGYLGETAGVKYAESQKWFYLSGMRNDERLLIECFDSEGLKKDGQVKGGRVPHSAFKDPRTREGAEARESIEVRALVFGP